MGTRLISLIGAIICTAGFLVGVYGAIKPVELLQKRKKMLGIEGKNPFFDSHPELERVGSAILASLCLLGLIKLVLRR